MPHYADGMPAKVGDVVKGKGYNLKNPDGTLREFVGTVVGIVPESGSCNIRVVTHELKSLPAEGGSPPYEFYQPAAGIFIYNHGNQIPPLGVKTTLEYGQCDHFHKIA